VPLDVGYRYLDFRSMLLWCSYCGCEGGSTELSITRYVNNTAHLCFLIVAVAVHVQ